jgi:hypothetical protein
MRVDRTRIANRQRSVQQRSLDRPPDIDDLDPAAQQLLSIVTKKIAYPLRPRFCGVVDVDAVHRLTQAAATVFRSGYASPRDVIENKDP